MLLDMAKASYRAFFSFEVSRQDSYIQSRRPKFIWVQVTPDRPLDPISQRERTTSHRQLQAVMVSIRMFSFLRRRTSRILSAGIEG
jgi:hypothetical protein